MSSGRSGLMWTGGNAAAPFILKRTAAPTVLGLPTREADLLIKGMKDVVTRKLRRPRRGQCQAQDTCRKASMG